MVGKNNRGDRFSNGPRDRRGVESLYSGVASRVQDDGFHFRGYLRSDISRDGIPTEMSGAR
jgi:hypothetical protein